MNIKKKSELMVKSLSVSIVFFISCFIVYGQDKITTKNKETLNVHILEKTPKYVKYQMTDYQDRLLAPVITVKTGFVEKIEYKNGVIDFLGNQNPRKEKPFGISVGGIKWLSSSGLISSATMDYFIIPQLAAEVNVGADTHQVLYFSAGARAHVNSNYSKCRLTPFTGVLFGYEYGHKFVQFPLGVNYLHKSGINVSMSFNKLIFSDNHYQTTVELRGGWRFKL